MHKTVLAATLFAAVLGIAAGLAWDPPGPGPIVGGEQRMVVACSSDNCGGGEWSRGE